VRPLVIAIPLTLTFHQRVQRLYAIDVEPFEFDFLRPMSHES
jgi:hypothetical protein